MVEFRHRIGPEFNQIAQAHPLLLRYLSVVAAIKRSSFEISKHLGLASWLARSRWRRRRLLVLCYHGVSLADEHKWDPELYISPSTLAHRTD